MVAFETLLLGIVTGLGTVRLMVAPPVATVEVRLDASVVAVLAAAPWQADCDFGANPMPHELTAVGRDAAGREVARASQWVNMGRERARLAAILERDPTTHRPGTIRLAWDALEITRPPTVQATLDGAALAVGDPHAIALPAVELAQPHLVDVEVSFSPTVRERANLAFGGDIVDQAESELTAVAVTLPEKRGERGRRDLDGAFSDRGEPLEPVAIEEGPAEVAIVVDRGCGSRSPRA
ncbi:MAG TPA: hypothetical protein VLW17_10935 [Thermoanaerobaculaceae bacterium]|nr:hypothetical protein [Thermoanaerobaculaceae bacterium]